MILFLYSCYGRYSLELSQGLVISLYTVISAPVEKQLPPSVAWCVKNNNLEIHRSFLL